MDSQIKAWCLYFPKDEYTAFNKEIQLIIQIRNALPLSPPHLKEILDSTVFKCDYEFFSKFSCSPTALNCFSCAVSEKIYENFNALIKVETRIVGHREISKFSEITIEKVGALVTIMGTCCRAGFRKIENLESYFECLGCSRIQRVKNQNNIYKQPKCGCKGKNFLFLPNHPDTKCIDKQEIKVQEIYTEENNIKIIEVDLYGLLVGQAIPGDLLELTGVVKTELTGEAYKLKIECINIETIKNRHNLNMLGGQNNFETYKKISEEENLIGILVNGLFPNIYGNSLIKMGLVLALFGGTKKYAGAQAVRPEIHVLIVGDPGLGKSRLLQAVSSVLPKSVYISGSFCTTAGLTVSITHDPMTGEYMADAGALVVSDGGVCCIDEFDKIDDHSALYEAMEDQRVTVTKGGVYCSVPTRTTVVAASNPKGGHFDAAKPLRANLKFEASLLSRFDLVFTLRDDLTEQENYEMGNQILKRRRSDAEGELSALLGNLRNDSMVQETQGSYPLEVLKGYVEYARGAVNPVLGKGARDRIKGFYIELRGSPGVSIRNLETLMRLTEGVARMALKEVATAQHAALAIRLYRRMHVKERGEERRKSLEGALADYVKREGKEISKARLMELIRGCSRQGEGAVLERLREAGVVVYKGGDVYFINMSQC